MLTRPEIVVLTQADAVPPEYIAAVRALFPADAMVISAVTGEGLKPLVHRTWATLLALRAH